MSNFRCSKCNIPLCSKSCQTKGDHQIECPVMEKVQDLKDQETPFKDWNLILPIRVLLLKHSDPAKYKALNNLVSNRSQKVRFDKCRKNITQPWKLGHVYKPCNLFVSKEALYSCLINRATR